MMERRKAVAGVTLEDLWSAAEFDPNPAQERAIAAVDGPLYLPAGPGAGKTRVLLWRTVNLIVFHGVPPEEIFLGTFTEKGAHQLREGLRALLAVASEKTRVPYDISRMAVGTIHSICHTILTNRSFVPGGRRPRTPVLLDEFAQYQRVYARRSWERLMRAGGLDPESDAPAITDYFTGRALQSRHEAVVNLLAFFNRCSEESVDPTGRPRKEKMLRALLAMYGEYRAMLEEDEEYPLTDLSLLQEHAYRRLVESSRGGEVFRHVIVDEYQDTNAIQERIYFRLAAGHKNLCVVGDDDQALYRFRGATVDNFLAFPERCRELLGVPPRTIPLVTNYRSRRRVVALYNDFMRQVAWTHRGRSYRVAKEIEAASRDARPAVFAAEPGSPAAVAEEVAGAVKALIEQKRVRDPSEIAFLYPSLKSACVGKMIDALERRGLEVYAPRAGTFLDVEEARRVFGLMLLVFGNPGHRHAGYQAWLAAAWQEAGRLVRADRALARFVRDRQAEIEEVIRTERRLLDAVAAAGIAEDAEFDDAARAAMLADARLGARTRRFLEGGSLRAYIRHQRERRPDRPITVRYVVNRATSLDWGVLDLFYQLTTFDPFKRAFDLAEAGTDEGPICNLSLISDYLARFQEQTSPVIGAQFLEGRKFARRFFASYLYSIYRLGESEYEDEQDPFPKGRIPFLTVHQAKGLEFPVVVLGNLRKDDRGQRKIDELMDRLGRGKSEPADRASAYDIARMFYVALSRPKQLLILCPFEGRGQRFNREFVAPMAKVARPLRELDPKVVVPDERPAQGAIPHPYSFTGDYIGFKICPRRYMLYRKYGFVPSRSQTTVFGNLVHQTIEDLHQWLMHEREVAR